MDCGDFDDSVRDEIQEYVRANGSMFDACTGSDMDENRDISMDELERAIGSLKTSKACGPDGIYSEMNKNGGVALHRGSPLAGSALLGAGVPAP